MDSVLALLWMLAAMLGGSDDDPACLVLGGLDATRSAAFVTGDTHRLGDVYVDERTARADIAVLRAYDERGLRLDGMRMVRERCKVRDRAAVHVSLEVVDRLGPTWVRDSSGRRRILPKDRATRHTVVLQRVGDVWRIAAVRSGPS